MLNFFKSKKKNQSLELKKKDLESGKYKIIYIYLPHFKIQKLNHY